MKLKPKKRCPKCKTLYWRKHKCYTVTVSSKVSNICKHHFGNTLLMTDPPKKKCLKCGIIVPSNYSDVITVSSVPTNDGHRCYMCPDCTLKAEQKIIDWVIEQYDNWILNIVPINNKSDRIVNLREFIKFKSILRLKILEDKK